MTKVGKKYQASAKVVDKPAYNMAEAKPLILRHISVVDNTPRSAFPTR